MLDFIRMGLTELLGTGRERKFKIKVLESRLEPTPGTLRKLIQRPDHSPSWLNLTYTFKVLQ